MSFVNEYFKKKTDKLSFFEIKENATLRIKGYPSGKYIPLPIKTDVLIKEVEKGNLEEEINISLIIDGIIYLIGADPSFLYIDDYIKILKDSIEKIEDYIFYRGIKNIEKNDYDNGAIIFRALKVINPSNLNGIFNYALTLEEIAKNYLTKEKEEGLEFLKQSTIELEAILNIDDKYPLAYYKLGYHYKYFEQFLKAKLIWTKHLALDEDELRLQEIRNEIDIIENDVILESGLTYLSYNKYDKALEMFLKLLPKFNKWWELNYFIAIAYKGLGEYKIASDYLYNAIELNKTEADLYNELGICLFTIEDMQGAIDIFTEGIDNITDDYKLLFNRGLAYLQLGKLEEAYMDINKASSLNPKDKNIIEQKQILENLLKK